MEPGRHAVRQFDGGHILEGLGIEDGQLAAVGGLVVDVAHQDTVVFGRVGSAGLEDKLAQHLPCTERAGGGPGAAEVVLESHDLNRFGLHAGPSLLDYRIPTAVDTPELAARIIESIDPEGPFGAKEAGEGPLHSTIPAIANAVFDAVGIRLRHLPFTPAKVLAALRAKEEQA